MKQDFDKIETFRKALNVLTKIHCGVSDYYDRDGARDELQLLSRSWRKPEDYVIEFIIDIAESTLDARSRLYVQRAAEALRLPIDPDELRERWKEFDLTQKIKAINMATEIQNAIV